MSEKPVFKISQELFNLLNNWQEKMDAKEIAEMEIEANNQDKKFSDSQNKSEQETSG